MNVGLKYLSIHHNVFVEVGNQEWLDITEFSDVVFGDEKLDDLLAELWVKF